MNADNLSTDSNLPIMTDNLWNVLVPDDEYEKNKELYQTHILEQYKIYVEMADRVSARRNLANVFFLTLHTTVLTAIGFAFQKIELVSPRWLTLFPMTGILTMCLVWWWLIQSYRQLNTAKYTVVGLLEKRLPSSPYWSAEWKELGEGKDLNKYLPLTSLERIIPILFGVIYILIEIYILCFMP